MKNNHLDFSLNIWLSISVLSPILDFIYSLIIGKPNEETGGFGVLIFIIFGSLMISLLPIYFLLVKFSKKTFELKIPNWQVKVILLLVIFFIIFSIHLLFFHKSIHLVSNFVTAKNYYVKYFILIFQFGKFYFLSATFSIWYFKIEREIDFAKTTSMENILDDNFHFKK